MVLAKEKDQTNYFKLSYTGKKATVERALECGEPYRALLFFAVLLAGLLYKLNEWKKESPFFSLLRFENKKPLLHPYSPSSTTGRARILVETDPYYTLLSIFYILPEN